MIQDLSRTGASRLTLATQAASAVLALGAVALMAVGLPERQRPGTAIPVASTPGSPDGTPNGDQKPGAPASDAIQAYRVDMGALADRLAMIDNAPTIPTPATPETAVTDTPTTPVDDLPPQPFASRVRYLGMIRVGDAAMAFVNIDGSQRVVRTGAVVAPLADRPELGSLTIQTIEQEAITVSHEDGTAKVTLTERAGPAITLVAGGDVERVEATPTLSPFETNANGNPLPEREVERRRRAIERQRTQNPRDYDGPGLQMPEIRRLGSMGTGRRDRGQNNQPEQSEKEAGGDD